MRIYKDIKLRQIAWSDGFPVGTATVKTVQGWMLSAGRSEFYSAKTAGYTISCVVEIAAADYSNEEECEIDGIVYRVVRQYVMNSQKVQLSLERL